MTSGTGMGLAQLVSLNSTSDGGSASQALSMLWEEVTSATGTELAVPTSPGLGTSQPNCGGLGRTGAAPACAGSRLEANKEVLVGKLFALCVISCATEIKLVLTELKP